MKGFAWFLARLAIAFTVASVLFVGVLDVGLIKTGVILPGSTIDTFCRLLFGSITLSMFIDIDLTIYIQAVLITAFYSMFAVYSCYMGYLTVYIPYILLKTPN